MLQLTPDLVAHLHREHARELERQERRAVLAAKAKTRKLNAKRRERLVDSAATILATGNPTMFAYEGACRHGFRVSLIDQGWTWSDADRVSADVVEAALNQAGAERPSWKEGQPEFVSTFGTRRYFCANCGTKIPDDRQSGGGFEVKYCSSLCGQVAYGRKARLFGEQVSLAEHLARCAERSAQTLAERARDCKECGRPFLAGTVTQEFCSKGCASTSMRRTSELSCVGCGKTFEPNRANLAKQRYCSHDCYAANSRKHDPAPCAQCGTIFQPRYSARRGMSRFCSAPCVQLARKAQGSGMRCEGVV